MELTTRAKQYLASLSRETPTPVGVVEQLFRDRNLVPDETWLEFHEKYAGYVEGGNPEVAIWGLCWETEIGGIAPRTLRYSRWPTPKDVEPSAIQCAYLSAPDTYDLCRGGLFVGYPAPSTRFETKIERTAIEKSFYKPGTTNHQGQRSEHFQDDPRA